MVRVVCEGKIKCCKFCNDLDYDKKHEGFCVQCGRPLDKKPGVDCKFIIGYVDRAYKQQQKVHFKCQRCSTITTL
jgi:hypothetical protein